MKLGPCSSGFLLFPHYHKFSHQTTTQTLVHTFNTLSANMPSRRYRMYFYEPERGREYIYYYPLTISISTTGRGPRTTVSINNTYYTRGLQYVELPRCCIDSLRRLNWRCQVCDFSADLLPTYVEPQEYVRRRRQSN